MNREKYYLSEDELLKPENMILLYARGAFPMTDEHGVLRWYLPELRTIIPLDNYNIPRSLRKFLKSAKFEFRYDTHYLDVIRNCAARETTWISEKLINAYTGLYKAGHLHTVEVWLDNELIGGLYGVTYKGAFFGESMFSKVPQASKAALVALIEHLKEKRFILLDVQYMTEHLQMFGAVEIDFAVFERLLIKSYLLDCVF